MHDSHWTCRLRGTVDPGDRLIMRGGFWNDISAGVDDKYCEPRRPLSRNQVYNNVQRKALIIEIVILCGGRNQKRPISSLESMSGKVEENDRGIRACGVYQFLRPH